MNFPTIFWLLTPLMAWPSPCFPCCPPLLFLSLLFLLLRRVSLCPLAATGNKAVHMGQFLHGYCKLTFHAMWE